MRFSLPILLMLFCFLSSIDFVAAQNVEQSDAIHNAPIGIVFNLYALEATRLEGKGNYSFSGSIFLDPRKSYSPNFDKEEFYQFYKQPLKHEEIIRIPGSHKKTKLIKFENSNEYFIALKFCNHWINHNYDNILKYQNRNVGNEIDCTECNFKYDLFQNDWKFTLYYEIKPLYREKQNDEVISIKNFEPISTIRESPTSPKSETIIKQTMSKGTTELDKSDIHPSINANVSNETKTSYRILFKVLPNANHRFNDLSEIGTIYTDTFDAEGNTRYLIGVLKTIEEARDLIKKVKAKGYKNSFITIYTNGQFSRYIQR